MRAKGYYYRDKDQAFMVDERMFKQINHCVTHGLPVSTNGHTLYPILEAPSEQELRKGTPRVPAYAIHDGGVPVIRWYWQIQEHKKAHSGCKSLGDGLCGFKMVRYAEWNETSKKWELLPMVNHASLEQERVLDSN